MSDNYEFVIVGSGAGGATLARELCKKGRKVLILEVGENVNPLPFVIESSRDGTDIFTAYGAGGATVLMNANGVRCLEKEFAQFSIHLDEDFRALEQELPLAPIHESLLSKEGSFKLLDLCQKAGLHWERMPKLMDHTKCTRCGQCSLGCPSGAKWTAREFLLEAQQLGAEVVFNTSVERVLVENGRAVGVEAIGPRGEMHYYGQTIVLAAGGLKTPVILQNSGIPEAGSNLAVDLCELWYGVTPDIDISDEPPMQLVNTQFLESEGFIHSIGRAKSAEKLRYYLKDKADAYMNTNWVSVIVKIRDEAAGRIYPDGSFTKPATPEDRKKLARGGEAAREFLMLAGATADTIVKRDGLYGGHNAASAAVGTIVNEQLMTRIDKLFVCDASVLPVAPGLPPVLTVMALARWLSRQLI